MARKHPDLWFEDGSVVLCAENMLFRVHMSLLSLHSVCFRDMFAIARPRSQCAPRLGHDSQDAEDGDDELKEFDGCPIVHLHDAAEDVAHLLNALYDPYGR